jgi:hypothetical protein
LPVSGWGGDRHLGNGCGTESQWAVFCNSQQVQNVSSNLNPAKAERSHGEGTLVIFTDKKHSESLRKPAPSDS